MAIVLKLVRGATTLTLNATYSATGFMVHSWVPKVATPEIGREPEPVTETMNIRTMETTQDLLATDLQALADMQFWARSYMEDSTETNPVWLHAKLTNETGERRALVRRIDVVFATPWFGPLADNAKYLGLELVIEREPYWEAVASAEIGNIDVTLTAGASVVVDYTASPGTDIVGDVAARLGYFAIDSATNGRLWVGIRSANKHPALANFIPIWECEDAQATLGTDAALAADTTASPGGAGNLKVTVTPGTASWANRLKIELQDVTANYSDNFGRFLWLLRAKVSAGTWELQLRHGFSLMADADLIQGPIVQLTSTSWNYLEMGVADMPSVDPDATDMVRTELPYAAIHIFARRTAGTGTLDLDCVCPVPVDEGFWKLGPWNASAGANPKGVLFQTPRNSFHWARVSSTMFEIPGSSQHSFSLPIGDGRLVIVYARNATSTLTDQIALAGGKYYPRWLSLRGSQ